MQPAARDGASVFLGENKGGKGFGCRVKSAAKDVSLADVQCENTGVAAAMQALRL